MFHKKGVFKNFAKFTGKHLCWNLFLKKVPAGSCSFLKKRLWQRYFPVNFAKFIRIAILQNICERLLLIKQYEQGLFWKLRTAAHYPQKRTFILQLSPFRGNVFAKPFRMKNLKTVTGRVCRTHYVFGIGPNSTFFVISIILYLIVGYVQEMLLSIGDEKLPVEHIRMQNYSIVT